MNEKTVSRNLPLKILFLASEATPFIKVGGLGDVAGALPEAIRSLDSTPDIRLILPLHQQNAIQGYPLKSLTATSIPHANGSLQAELFETHLSQLPVYFVSGSPFSQSSAIYTSDPAQDALKYTFFSLAALELIKAIGWAPDIIHAQDWHTAPAIYALKTKYHHDPFYTNTGTLLTVHNLPYLGSGAGSVLRSFGLLPASKSVLPSWAQDLPLPLGLLSADKINTVSQGYANEILTPEFGSGLEDFLKTRQEDLSGILNGLDQTIWDPETDPSIEHNYSIETFANRQKNKTSLLRELDLPANPDQPLLAFIGRMDHQKGIDIALDAMRQIRSTPWQAILLGTGDAKIEAQARQLAKEMPDRVRVAIRFDPNLARRIYAGADVMLVPSRYEPCGLIQMIAMRYGCVPLARATGGLRDTIKDNSFGTPVTGFLFADPSSESMASSLSRALSIYSDKRRWHSLQRRCMKQDFSWHLSAEKYYQLYRSILKKKPLS